MELTKKEVNDLIDKALDERETYNAFAPSLIAYHTHNGTDSPIIPFSGIFNISFVTSSATLGNQVVVLVNATAGAITLTLPNAGSNTGRQYIIKDWKGKSATNPITLATQAGQTIDGTLTKSINNNYAAFYILSDGNNWTVL